MAHLESSHIPHDSYKEQIASARNSFSVLKLKLLQLKSRSIDSPVFVFEGDDDKIIYFNWVRRVRGDLIYEPFPCNGKKNVLGLRDSLSRDLGDARDGVYFFLDRDFDDLRGQQPDHMTFVTDRYSTENYLVSERVLDSTLKNEFHCHGQPDLRKVICARFRDDYNSFLSCTRDINERWYIACKSGVGIFKKPEKLKDVASISIGQVLPHQCRLEDIIQYIETPDDYDVQKLSHEFSTLEPENRYRGKFALMFFEKWLALLVIDYNSSPSIYFGSMERTGKVRTTELTLSGFAAKSELQTGLKEFLELV